MLFDSKRSCKTKILRPWHFHVCWCLPGGSEWRWWELCCAAVPANGAPDHVTPTHTHARSFLWIQYVGVLVKCRKKGKSSLCLSLAFSSVSMGVINFVSEIWDLCEFPLDSCINVWLRQSDWTFCPKRPPFATAHCVKLRQRHAEDFFRLVIVPWPNQPSHVRQCGDYRRRCEHIEQSHTSLLFLSPPTRACIPIHLSIYLFERCPSTSS